MLYKSYFNKKTGTYYSQIKKEGLSEKLIVVDEASMLSESLFNDLMTISGNFKILFVGDDAQLPPINSDFNIMKNPPGEYSPDSDFDDFLPYTVEHYKKFEVELEIMFTWN